MNIKSNSTSNKRNSRKEEYQNRFYNTLMNQYYRNHKISSNVKNSVILNKNSQNDNETGDSVLMNMWNTIYKKNSYVGDNAGYNYSNKTIDFKSKVSYQNPVNPRNKVIKIKNQKISHIKRRILEGENNNYGMGYNNNTYNNSYNINYNIDNNDSYKNKYKNRNFINDNENLNNDEPFFLNDKYINNSFVINLEEKFKNTNNNKGNESNSRQLEKDLPSSLNNTQKYINQKYSNDESNSKNNSNSNKKYLQKEYPKEVNAFRLRDKNVAFEEKQINMAKNAKNTINYRKIKNVKYEINSSHNQINNNNNSIKLNTFKIMNARKQNNKNMRNNISSNQTFENSLNNIELKNTRTKPVKPLFPIRYFFVNKNEIIDSINNDSNKNSKNNSKIFSKIPKSIDNFNKSENSFFKKASGQPSEIESCVISFRNSKKVIKIENMKSKLNYSQNNENDSNYIKKNIAFDKIEKTAKRRIIINDNKGNELNKTTYKLYKKPSLNLNQNIYNENKRNNDKKGVDDYYSQSYFSTYNKNDDKTNNNDNNNNDLFNKRQYLGNVHKKVKNNNNKSFSIQNRNVFIKKTISSSVVLNNNRTGNNSPIYAKKIPQSYIKIQAPSNNNMFNYNSSSNIPQINKNRNKKNIVYSRVSNNNINPTYKLFNSQIINIKNNIFNNNNYYNNELINNENEPLERENQIEANNVNRKANKSGLINTTIANDFNHYKKYYNFFSKISKEEPNIFENIPTEEIIKRNIMSLCYYTKNYIKLYKIPIVSESYCSKIHILNSNNKEIIKKGKNLSSNQNSNQNKNKNKKLINQNQNINIKTRNKIVKVENVTKSYNEELNNMDNKKEYDTRTYRIEIVNIDNNIDKIEVSRKRSKSKSVKESNNDIYNIKKINPKDKKAEEKENNINKFETMIDNINKINNTNNDILNKKNEKKNNDKKDLKISSKSKYRNNFLRKQRSSSHKMKDKQFNKNNNKNKDKKNNNNVNNDLNTINNNIVKIKVSLPNSEARRKKYKINIVKRVKVKYKKSVNDFSEEKILINSINNEINEENSLRRKRNKTIMQKNNRKEIDKDKDNKIVSIIKEDLENYISFSLKNQQNNTFTISNNYNFSIIEQLLIKEKIDLSDLIEYYLKIGLETLDSKDKIIIANDYIQNIVENYKRTYINKSNFVKTHEDILELLIDIAINLNKKRIKNITNIENKFLYDIIGALFYSLLINELFFVSDLNKFINCEEQVLINIAKIVRFIIIYANDENMKNNYFETFKNCKLFFNNPIYFKYVTKYLKLINSKSND